MNTNVPYFDLKRQSSLLEKDIELSIRKVIQESAFSSGPFVSIFEEQFAHYLGCKHVVGLNSGTSALHLGLLAMKIPPGSEVITTPMSFIATCWGISYAGLRPVFVDINEKTGLLELDEIVAKITPKTKAILPVHLYGNAVNPEQLSLLADKHGLAVLEDSAQAHGTLFKERHVGHYFSAGAFSFYPGKSLGAYGEGGALATNDDKIAEAARKLREHGSSVKYQHDIMGFNYRMDGIQSAVLSIKLKHLEQWIVRRRQIAATYSAAFKHLPLELPVETTDSRHSYHLYVIKDKNRDSLANHLHKNGIGTSRHYPIPLHLQPAYSFLGYKQGDLPNAERHANECLSLPMFPEMTEIEVSAVIHAVCSFYA